MEPGTFGPTSTNGDLQTWVQQQLSQNPKEGTIVLNLKNCPNITDATILEPLVLSLKNLKLKDSGIREINPHSPLWLILDDTIHPRWQSCASDYECEVMERYENDIELMIKFSSWPIALDILCGHTMGEIRTDDRNVFVCGYKLPNGKEIHTGLVGRRCFYPQSHADRLKLFAMAKDEYQKTLEGGEL
jgi:hypothetical protein